MRNADTLFFNFGKIIWVPLLLIGVWFQAFGYQHFGSLLTCSFRSLTGIPCPGCGGTRAVYSVFSGHLGQSFRYHPAVIFMIGAYIHFMLLYMYRHRTTASGPVRAIRIEWYAYLLIAVILGQWFVKLARILF